MNKQAENMAFPFLIVLLITIGGALLYFVLLPKIHNASDKLGDYELCKNSNIANAQIRLKIDTQVLTQREGNKCKTEYTTAPKGKEIPLIANRMATCWDMYLEGKQELFETKDNNYCAFCSVIDFDPQVKPAPIGGLTNYLLTTHAPRKDMTYYEYLSGSKVEKEVLTQLSNTDLKKLGTIDTSSPVAVVFTMSKDANPNGVLDESAIKTGTMGTVIAAIPAGAVGTYYMLSGSALCASVLGCVAGAALIFKGAFILVSGSAAGGLTGYALGSQYLPNLETKIVLVPYKAEALEKLQCTRLEGQDYLEIKK